MKYNRILSSLVLAFLLGLIIWGIYGRFKLNNKFSLTSAKVTNCRFLPKSAGNIDMTYEYYVNSKKVIRSSPRIWLTTTSCNEHFLGKTFPVVYNPDDKEISALLLTPSDFKRFKYSFPDSLKWVVKYIDKQYQ
jgi:hypothetical protein